MEKGLNIKIYFWNIDDKIFEYLSVWRLLIKWSGWFLVYMFFINFFAFWEKFIIISVWYPQNLKCIKNDGLDIQLKVFDEHKEEDVTEFFHRFEDIRAEFEYPFVLKSRQICEITARPPQTNPIPWNIQFLKSFLHKQYKIKLLWIRGMFM